MLRYLYSHILNSVPQNPPLRKRNCQQPAKGDRPVEIARICPEVIRFHDETNSTFYLVIGERKALAIDTGTGRAPVLPEMRKHTDLPIELAVTHAHGDHYGASNEFDTVYMHPADIAVLPEMEAYFTGLMGVPPVRRETLRPVRGGDVIDLGGARIRVLELRGHSPGSVAFVDEGHQLVFTGDAIGSGMGVWMQVFNSLSIAAYRDNLARFCREAEPYAGYRFLCGHCNQMGEEGTERYNPPCMAMAEDMIALCDRVLAGTAEAVEAPGRSFTDECAVVAKHGRAKMVYMRDRLR